MKKTLGCIVFFLILVQYTRAGEVVITGKDTAYVGQEIVFNKFSDGITKMDQELASCTVKKDGSFSLHFNIDEITFVYAYLGKYRVHLYAEPGKTYNVILPPRKDKEMKDILNPYFSPIVVQLATTKFNENDLNILIRMFNDSFQPYYNKNIVDADKRTDYTGLDKEISVMEKPFASSKNQFFNNYRYYRYGLLRNLSFEQKTKSISDEYFKGKPVLYNNPAYMELFNQIYDKYFYHFSTSPKGKELTKDITDHDLKGLRKTLASDKVLGDGELLDLVILKNLHDEFYEDNYPHSDLLKILDDFIATTKNENQKEIALHIKSKVTKLLTGFAPPDFHLYDGDSNLVSLKDFRGKYVYLNFCSCFSYTCLKDFDMLNTLYKKHHDILQIVTILIDNDENVIKNFLKRSKYPWVFLHYGHQSDILKEYDIRAFPTYYLIDPEGKLAFSPAPGPDENFEARFFQLLQQRKDDKLRTESK